jgi:hypothetical protein
MKVNSSVPQSRLLCIIFINHCRPNIPSYLAYAGDKMSLKTLKIKQITLKLSNTQDRQSTYDVTLRRVRAAIVAAGKQCVLHNLCVYL